MYKPKKHPPISTKNQLFINNHLDKELEKTISYELKKLLSHIQDFVIT